MVRNKTLPGISFGKKSCSMKWKGQPMDQWVKKNFAGQQTQRLIGYDAGQKDRKRCGGAMETNHSSFHWIYPLIALGWTREKCIEQIQKEGLPVPIKSACFFCSATSQEELTDLAIQYPKLARLAVAMEDIAKPGLREIEGIWGKAVKGIRNPEKKRTGSWRTF
jgi:hypothetical protein